MTAAPGRAARLILTLAPLLLALPLAAQEARPAPDFTTWETLAAQTEQRLDDKSLSAEQLAEMRATIVTWRDDFIAAQGANTERIAGVRRQIDALGPAPAEGATEAEDIAARRKTLNDRLAELQAPGLNATESRAAAEALIGQIDAAARAQATSALLTTAPSPLVPANWANAATAVSQWSGALGNETRARLADGRTAAALHESGALAVALVTLALLLMIRGRRMVERAAAGVFARANLRGRRALSVLISLGQILLPVAGVVLIIVATDLFEITGVRGSALIEGLAVAGVTFFVGHWLARQIFPRSPAMAAALPVAEASRREGRLHVTLLGLMVGLRQFLDVAILANAGVPATFPPNPASAATASVLSFPVIVLAALVLFRVAQLIRRGLATAGEADPHTSRNRILWLVTLAALLVSVVAPLAAAAGYLAVANAILWPTIMSLLVIGLMIILHDFFVDIYAAWVGDEKSARDALLPVITGFVLILVSVPAFALIWGLSPAELADMWTRFQAGASLGGVKISPIGILSFAVVFAIGYALTRVLQGSMRKTVLPRTRLDHGAQNAIVSGLGYVGIFLAGLAAITSAGIDLSSLAIVAGALSVGIGFGLQNIVSNFVSGIILLIERPITEGDWVEVGGRQGYVRAISVRSTRIETFDRADVIVPNADFVSGQVINYTRGNLNGRLILRIGVAYGTDTRRVSDILREIAENQPLVMVNPPPNIVFMDFGPSSLDFEVRVILSDVNQSVNVRTEMNHQIAERFAAEGIEIPFPQSDLWLRNPEALQPPPAAG